MRQPTTYDQVLMDMQMPVMDGSRPRWRSANALDTGDVALAQRLARALKGAAGNLGAEPLQAAAGAL